MRAWKKILDPQNYSNEQQNKEYLEVMMFFCFLLLGAFVGIIKMVFWQCKDWGNNLFVRVFKKKKES